MSLPIFLNAIHLDHVIAQGHDQVQSTHRTTLEITTETFLTPRGNCILGVCASKSCFTLDPNLKKAIQTEQKIGVIFTAGTFQDYLIGYGQAGLSLTNPISMVFRTSSFLSDRTVLINCSKASNQIRAEIITYLQDPAHSLHIDFFLLENQELR